MKVDPSGRGNMVRRDQKRRMIQVTQQHVNRARKTYEAALAERDAALRLAHGDPRHGGLSYDEMAAETDLSRQRVIQLVQGKSEYSKSRSRRR